jgi:6-pyruvoyltetrahydropterin/6-carboxytetrahydropterin synthase
MMAKYLSTKTYGTDRGLSCCFRQWRADHSHCSLIHGYSIGIKLVFESETLDEKNWVMDFGGLKAFKEWADWQFDHTMCVALDDPHLETFKQLNKVNGGFNDSGVCDLRIVPGVGCEKFAELAFRTMNEILAAYQESRGWTHPDGRVFEARYPVGAGVRLRSAEVFEHAGNSAIYEA